MSTQSKLRMIMDVDYNALGCNIRNVRQNRKLTQEELAEEADLSIPHVSHIETGKTKVSLPALMSIAYALGTSVDSLLYGKDGSKTLVEFFNYDKEIHEILDDCSMKERRAYIEGLRLMKNAYRRGISDAQRSEETNNDSFDDNLQ